MCTIAQFYFEVIRQIKAQIQIQHEKRNHKSISKTAITKSNVHDHRTTQTMNQNQQNDSKIKFKQTHRDKLHQHKA